MRTLPFVQMTSMSAPSDALKLQTEDARQHGLFKNHPRYHPFETRIRSCELTSNLNYRWAASKKTN